jgi:hypothetical protein
MMISYEGRRFRAVTGAEDAPIARYRQQGDLVWAEFAGHDARRGSLAGVCAPDGTLDFAYCMVLDSGAVISGHCTSTPEMLAGGRIRLHEKWERFGRHAAVGESTLEEV